MTNVQTNNQSSIPSTCKQDETSGMYKNSSLLAPDFINLSREQENFLSEAFKTNKNSEWIGDMANLV